MTAIKALLGSECNRMANTFEGSNNETFAVKPHFHCANLSFFI